MKYQRIVYLSLAAFLMALVLSAREGVFAQAPGVSPSQDICGHSVKLSVPLAYATATTVPLVSASSATSPLNVCSISLGVASSGTAQLVAGTGTACATNQEAVTGAYPAGVYDRETTLAIVPTGKDLCLKTTGTGGGVITYASGGLTQPTATNTPTPTPTLTPAPTPT